MTDRVAELIREYTEKCDAQQRTVTYNPGGMQPAVELTHRYSEIEMARADYLRDRIDVDEMERVIDHFLRLGR